MKCMNRLYNSRDTELFEKFQGIMLAQPGKFVYVENPHSNTMYCADLEEQVQIIINGGGGYGPLFAGFLNPNLAQAVCEGDFDCAPNAYALYDVAKTIDRGKGVLFIANNFTGDYLNNDMAQELLRTDGIASGACYVSDDIMSAFGEPKEKRGGLSGIGLVIKAASAAAKAGLPLEEVCRIAEKTNERLRTITVRLTPDMSEMEFGPGFSGEPALTKEPFETSSGLVKKAIDILLGELGDIPACRYEVQVNRLRETTYVEGYVLLNDTDKYLKSLGKEPGICACGCYFDVFDGKGCMISLVAADKELAQYLTPVQNQDFSI